jgi:hypothetical protein
VNFVLGNSKTNEHFLTRDDTPVPGDLPRVVGRLTPGKWHQVTVSMRGEHIECRVDDVVVLQHQIAAHPCGYVRLFGTRCAFRNVSVKVSDGTVLWEGVPEWDRTERMTDEAAQQAYQSRLAELEARLAAIKPASKEVENR